MDCTTGSAPGRLDVLGGVADYSGALVLEMPTRQSIDVRAETDDALVVGPAVLSVADTAHLAELEYVDVRRALEGLPRWTLYLIGVAVVLVRHGIISPPRVRLHISSDLPQSMGVASSAALEVATARALGAGTIDPLQLALLCQEAENFVVGAPCGVMDQVAVAVGSPGAVLPILCRPASPRPPSRSPPISRSSAGRAGRRTTSAARPTDGPVPRPSWGSASSKRPKNGRGPGSASFPPQSQLGSPKRSVGTNFSSGGARPVTPSRRCSQR